ncbi:glycosyltransferase, partial [Octadecabacter sp.]|nr:glycosyltransferase [Octadecabacter sp.]
MRAWIIKTGEPALHLPAEAGDRLFRAGLMAQTLHARGHEVTWWNAQFHHQLKSMRNVPASTVLRPNPDGPEMIFLPSRGYTSHLSPRRFLDHRDARRAFEALAPKQPRPDVILCAWPTIDLAFAAVQFGRAHGIPVILDIRDLWPDIFYERITAKTGLPFKGYFIPWERMGRKAMQGADGVVSITQGMLEWGQKRFARKDNPRDRVFYQSQSATPVTEDMTFWTDKGADLDGPKTRLVWAGTLISDLDIQTLLEAIETLPEAAANELEFVFCGSGDLSARIEEMARRLPHVIFGGWASQGALSALYDRSHIGMMCYLDRFDFQLSIPNKVADFTRSNLRILTNLKGEMQRVLGPDDLLIHYPTGDVAALRAKLIEIAENPAIYRTPAPKARA